MEYTEFSPMPFGRYRGKLLCKVPVKSILECYDKGSLVDVDFKLWVEKNMARLKAVENLDLPLYPDPVVKLKPLRCKKIYFITEGAARRELKRIRETKHNDKKPVRVYECPKCNFWHLTSLPIEEFK